MRVLIVEDEKRLAQALGQIMEEQRTVRHRGAGRDAA